MSLTVDSSQPAQTEQPMALWRACSPWLLGAMGAALYALTLCRFPYPVESAVYVAAHSGLDAMRTLQDPIWGSLVRGVFALAGEDAVLLLNGLGIPLALITLLLLFHVVVHQRHESPVEVPVPTPAERSACLLSAWVAALFLGTTAPFWFVATRAHPAAWHLVLISAVSALMASAPRRGPGRLGWAALLAGLGTMAVPAMLWLLPLFAGYAILLLLVHHWWSPRRVVMLAAFFLVGAVAALPALLPYQHSDVFAWREFGGFLDLLRIYARDHLAASLALTSGAGWLLGTLTLTLPWAVAVAWPAIDPRHRLGESAAFHFVLAVLAVLLMLDVGISSWSVLQLRRLSVVPYLLASVWVGHVAGFWWRRLQATPYFESPFRFQCRRAARRLFLPALGALAVVSGWMHGRDVAPVKGWPAVLYAEQTIAALPDSAWLFSDGVLDANLLLAAHRQRRPLRLVNLAMTRNPVYARYVQSLADTPRLRTLADVGPGALIGDLLAEDATDDRVALMHSPAALLRQGLEPTPEVGFYRGRHAGEAYDIDASFIRHEGFWASFESAMARAKGAPSPVADLNQWVAGRVARLANDLGVGWEDANRADVAQLAYQTALRLQPDHVSAMLNLMSLAHRQQQPEYEELQARLLRVKERTREPMSFWMLAERFGVVRHPEAYVERGWLWARSGRLDAAIRDLEQAADTPSGGARIDMALASLYFQKEDDAQSVRHYQAVLLEEPDNTSALLGLGRIAMRQGKYAEADPFFRRVLELNPDSPVAPTELGILAFLSGRREEAEAQLRKVSEVAPDSVRPLYLLGLIATGRGDPDAVEEWEARLAQIDGVEAVLARASLAREGRRFSEARRMLESLAAVPETRGTALQLLLEIDMAEGRMDAADQHARSLLEVDVEHPLANLVLGSIQYAKGQVPEAEASFRAALRRKPSAEAHNSLAWLLAEQGDLKAGLMEVREALRLDPRHGPAWDTLGVILHRMKRADQAVVALRKGLEYYPGRWDFKLHLAEALHDAGDLEACRALANELVASPQGVSSNLLDRARRLAAPDA